MKHFSIIEPPTEKFVVLALKSKGVDMDKFKGHSGEDYLLASDRHPIFVVADGVTMNMPLLSKRGKQYPNPSPPGDVARIFCESVMKKTEERYKGFLEEDVVDVFRQANDTVGKYNKKYGRTDESGNPTGYFSATGAFVVIKEPNIHWGSVCDSYVAHFNSGGGLMFWSPGCEPYGVINGQPEAVEHLRYGTFGIKEGDFVALFSDGFEEYMKDKNFVELFLKWPDDLESRVKVFTARKADEDPEAFGRERSLIVLSV